MRSFFTFFFDFSSLFFAFCYSEIVVWVALRAEPRLRVWLEGVLTTNNKARGKRSCSRSYRNAFERISAIPARTRHFSLFLAHDVRHIALRVASLGGIALSPPSPPREKIPLPRKQSGGVLFGQQRLAGLPSWSSRSGPLPPRIPIGSQSGIRRG